MIQTDVNCTTLVLKKIYSTTIQTANKNMADIKFKNYLPLLSYALEELLQLVPLPDGIM